MNSRAYFRWGLTSLSGLGRQYLTKHHLSTFISFPKHIYICSNQRLGSAQNPNLYSAQMTTKYLLASSCALSWCGFCWLPCFPCCYLYCSVISTTSHHKVCMYNSFFLKTKQVYKWRLLLKGFTVPCWAMSSCILLCLIASSSGSAYTRKGSNRSKLLTWCSYSAMPWLFKKSPFFFFFI